MKLLYTTIWDGTKINLPCKKWGSIYTYQNINTAQLMTICQSLLFRNLNSLTRLGHNGKFSTAECVLYIAVKLTFLKLQVNTFLQLALMALSLGAPLVGMVAHPILQGLWYVCTYIKWITTLHTPPVALLKGGSDYMISRGISGHATLRVLEGDLVVTVIIVI